MAVCCCSLAGTAACQHCRNNPMATDVWTNKTVTVDHVEANPFGNGLDVCPACGKPTTIGKPQTNADCIRSMTDEELTQFLFCYGGSAPNCRVSKIVNGCTSCRICWLDWLKQEAEEGE